MHDEFKHVMYFLTDLCEFWEQCTSARQTCRLVVDAIHGSNQKSYYVVQAIIPRVQHLSRSPLLAFCAHDSQKSSSRKRKGFHRNTATDQIFAPYAKELNLQYFTGESVSAIAQLLAPQTICEALGCTNLDKLAKVRLPLDRSKLWSTDGILPMPHHFNVTLLNNYIHSSYSSQMHVIELIREHISLSDRDSSHLILPVMKDLLMNTHSGFLYPDPLKGLQRWLRENPNMSNVKDLGVTSEFNEWMQTIFNGFVDTLCCPSHYVNHLFCLYDIVLSQFDGETNLLKYMQLHGMDRMELDSIMRIVHGISVPNTFLYLDSRSMSHVGQPSQAYQLWYDISNTMGNERKKTTALREQIIQDSFVTVEETTIDEYSGKKSTSLKTIRVATSLIRASTQTIQETERPLPSSQYIITLPLSSITTSNSERESIKITRQFKSLMNNQREQQFIGVMRELSWLSSISRLAITLGIHDEPQKLFARLVLNQLIQTLERHPMMIRIESSDIDRIIESATNKAIMQAWITNRNTRTDWNVNDIVEVGNNIHLTLNTILWSFCQYFPMVKNRFVETLMSSVYNRYLNLPQVIRKARALFLGEQFANVSSVSLKNSLDLLMAYYAFDFGELNSKGGFAEAAFDGILYLNLNYIGITARSFDALVDIFSLILSTHKEITKEQIKEFLLLPAPNVRAVHVLPFIEKCRLENVVKSNLSNRKVTQIALQNWCTNNGFNYRDNPAEVNKRIQELFVRDLKILSTRLKSGDPFHRISPQYVYNESVGLPLFNIKLFKKGIECRILTECFQDSYNDILVQSIRSLSNLVEYQSKYDVNVLVGNRLQSVSIENATHEEPFLKVPVDVSPRDIGEEAFEIETLESKESIIRMQGSGFDEFVVNFKE